MCWVRDTPPREWLAGGRSASRYSTPLVDWILSTVRDFAFNFQVYLMPMHMDVQYDGESKEWSYDQRDLHFVTIECDEFHLTSSSCFPQSVCPGVARKWSQDTRYRRQTIRCSN